MARLPDSSSVRPSPARLPDSKGVRPTPASTRLPDSSAVRPPPSQPTPPAFGPGGFPRRGAAPEPGPPRGRQRVLADIPEAPEGFELLWEAPAGSVAKRADDGPIEAPPGFELLSVPRPPEPEAPGIGGRIAGRFLGTDVEDPLEFPRLGTTFTGAVAGGIAGSRTPVAPGPAGLFVNPLTGGMAGATLGAAAGAIAPETTLELGETAGVFQPGTRERLGLSPEDLRTVLEGEVLLEIATGGGLSALRLGGRGVARFMSGTTREGVSVAERAGERGIHLMPVQVGNRPIARGFVSVMGRFPFIGTAFKKRGQAAEDALRATLEGLGERTGPLRAFSDISETIFSDAEALLKATNAYFGRQYRAVFAAADELGVQVVPRATLDKADEILRRLAEQTPRRATGEGRPGPALQVVKSFIEDEILPLRAGRGAVVKQSFKQMDGLISQIDQQIASLEPGQRRFALSLMTQLRQAAQGDVVANARGLNADEVARRLREVDAEFSQTMSEVFETATAKQFASVRRRGLRAIEFDDATRIPIDQLARTVIKLDSPQAMGDLAKLVSADTYKAITARVIDDAVADSLTAAGEVGRRFDPDVFAKRLGLNKPGGARHKAVTAMLREAGGDIQMSDLEAIDEAARAISGLDLPNVSSFIARRATIGGLQSIINGVVPGLALVGAGGGVGGVSGSVVGFLTFVLGGRGVSAMLSNPGAVRTFRAMAKEDAKKVFGKNGIVPSFRRDLLGLTRAAAFDLQNEEGVSTQEFQRIVKAAKAAMEAFDDQIKDLH